VTTPPKRRPGRPRLDPPPAPKVRWEVRLPAGLAAQIEAWASARGLQSASREEVLAALLTAARHGE
jgi:hypothetical protein